MVNTRCFRVYSKQNRINKVNNSRNIKQIGTSEYEMALFEAQELEVYLNYFLFKV